MTHQFQVFSKSCLRQWRACGQGEECECRLRNSVQMLKVDNMPSLVYLASFVDVRGTGVVYTGSARRYRCPLARDRSKRHPKTPRLRIPAPYLHIACAKSKIYILGTFNGGPSEPWPLHASDMNSNLWIHILKLCKPTTWTKPRQSQDFALIRHAYLFPATLVRKHCCVTDL